MTFSGPRNERGSVNFSGGEDSDIKIEKNTELNYNINIYCLYQPVHTAKTERKIPVVVLRLRKPLNNSNALTRTA